MLMSVKELVKTVVFGLRVRKHIIDTDPSFNHNYETPDMLLLREQLIELFTKRHNMKYDRYGYPILETIKF